MPSLHSVEITEEAFEVLDRIKELTGISKRRLVENAIIHWLPYQYEEEEDE